MGCNQSLALPDNLIILKLHREPFDKNTLDNSAMEAAPRLSIE